MPNARGAWEELIMKEMRTVTRGGFRIRKSFTLIELLVVIAIISILAALITVAAARVRITVMNSRMKLEVSNMDQALNAFKEKFGCYPPDGNNTLAIQSFLVTAFPRIQARPCRHCRDRWPSILLLPWSSGWAGFRDQSGNFIGFSADPTDPFNVNYAAAHGAGTYQPARIQPFFDFQMSRIPPISTATPLISGYQYFPDNGLAAGIGTNSPYLYFAASNGTYFTAVGGSTPSSYQFSRNPTTTYTYTMNNKTNVTCSPYVLPDPTATSSSAIGKNTWVNPKTFQIICPGMDGVYGPGNSYPNGAYQNGGSILATNYPTANAYTPSNYDDITNFTVRATIQDDMP